MEGAMITPSMDKIPPLQYHPKTSSQSFSTHPSHPISQPHTSPQSQNTHNAYTTAKSHSSAKSYNSYQSHNIPQKITPTSKIFQHFIIPFEIYSRETSFRGRCRYCGCFVSGCVGITSNFVTHIKVCRSMYDM